MMSGLEALRTFFSRPQPAPGIGALIGMRCTEIEPGRVVFALVPGHEHDNPLNKMHGGIVCTMLDSAMSCAVHTALPAGVSYTTIEIKVNFDHSISVDTGEIHATGTVIKVGRKIAVAEGRVVDRAGDLLAHGTTTCLVLNP